MWLSLRRGTWVSLTLELAAKMVWRWQLLLPEWKFRGYFITLTPQKHTRGRETLESHQLCLYTSYLLHILLLQTFTACACWLGPCAKAKAIANTTSTWVSAAPRAGSPFYPSSCSSDLCSFSSSSWLLSHGCSGYDRVVSAWHMCTMYIHELTKYKKKNKQTKLAIFQL